MIVEDELIIQLVTKQSVVESGYNFCGLFTSGLDAIEGARTSNPDIILMDIKLEGEMNGIEAMEKIREFSDVPVIYITGNSDSYHKNKAAATKMSAFLVKPVDFKVLVYAIQKAIDQHSPS